MAVIKPTGFKPAWWLTNPHLQTLWPSQFRKRPDLPLTKERLELPDGDFIDLAWMPETNDDLCLIIHGLEGSLYSHYARPLIQAASLANKHVVFMHLRGCSGEPNRLPRRYHSGDTADIRFVIESIKQRHPDKHIYAIAVSLGGNMLLKYLSEYGNDSHLEFAIAISVPFDLAIAGVTLNKGIARIYQRHLLNSLQKVLYQKNDLMDMPISMPDKNDIDTIYDFDDKVTAPLHGFKNANDYYARCSSRQFIPAIKTPTHIIHALDDPFITPEAIPNDNELPDCVTLELSQKGGHVGFVSGKIPVITKYWIDDRVRHLLQKIK